MECGYRNICNGVKRDGCNIVDKTTYDESVSKKKQQLQSEVDEFITAIGKKQMEISSIIENDPESYASSSFTMNLSFTPKNRKFKI